MDFTQLNIPGVVLLTPQVWGDARGFFMETFRQSEFEAHCGSYTFVQDNHSKSVAHTLRGLHFQKQHPQGKLVRVVRGAVFDVAVDLRPESPTCGQWVGALLTAENKQMLWIPPRFAHGFYVTGEGAEFVYKCTDYYAPGDEASIRWDDPEIGVRWPLAGTPLLSEKDAHGISYKDFVAN